MPTGSRATDRRFSVGHGEEGDRLDVFVAAHMPELSRANAQRLIREGHVTVDGAVAKPASHVQAGSVVAVLVPPAREPQAVPQEMPLDIVYEDSDLLVVNKPPGMVVHPAAGNWDGTLVNALLAHCPDLAAEPSRPGRGRAEGAVGGRLRPGIVHRLDKDTSGLLVVARNDRAHRRLQAQISARTAKREYWAIVWGADLPVEFEVDAPIGRHPRHRKKMAVVGVHGRPARTACRLLRRLPPMSLVEARLQTGRTHQIRVHLSHLRHPVVGDPVYGGRRSPPKGTPPAIAEAVAALPGQALHARSLGFEHPGTGEELTFQADPPEAFRRLLEALEEAPR